MKRSRMERLMTRGERLQSSKTTKRNTHSPPTHSPSPFLKCRPHMPLPRRFNQRRNPEVAPPSALVATNHSPLELELANPHRKCKDCFDAERAARKTPRAERPHKSSDKPDQQKPIQPSKSTMSKARAMVAAADQEMCLDRVRALCAKFDRASHFRAEEESQDDEGGARTMLLVQRNCLLGISQRER